MTGQAEPQPWTTDGKFFRAGGERVWLKAVTYGPFPGGWPEDFMPDLVRISAAGFNAVRLYEMPGRALLDAAWACGLRVMGGLEWSQNTAFTEHPGSLADACRALEDGLRETAGHPALAAVYVGNEIPADLVRWMGPDRVRESLERLIAHGRAIAPSVMFAYANYPSTEYLEPANADFSAFNIYLERESDFRDYLRRLHHIAGDRPLVVSEFGLDSRRNGLEKQAETLAWAVRSALTGESAGITLYAWSDRWWNEGAEVTDWDFGLTDRAGADKPALETVRAAFAESPVPPVAPLFSVIVCTRNGASRIAKCLTAIGKLAGGPHECVVVDDGSTDGTADIVARGFPGVKPIHLTASGLSAARNAGAAAATGEWLAFTDDDCEPDAEWLLRLRPLCAGGRFAAVGGPNLPPPPRDWQEAVVCASPGAPSHVMLTDEEAEHLPGCNLVVSKTAFDAVGGFDPRFRTAGDDVDFCWRLRDAGYRLGFAPGAFVWHWRRPSVRAFLRQQIGYGHAERLLLRKHPRRFSADGGARWEGFVYGGGPIRADGRSIIYHGPMGMAGYQSVVNRMLPLRDLAGNFGGILPRTVLRLVGFLQPLLRGWARDRRLALPASDAATVSESPPSCEIALASPPAPRRDRAIRILLENGWTPGGPTDPWDLTKHNTRVQIATEHGRGIHKTLRLRIWGSASRLPDGLRPQPAS